jgi:hypothetical protein
MSGSRRYETESYNEEHEAWVLETSRTSEKVAHEDVALLKSLGKKARIVGES